MDNRVVTAWGWGISGLNGNGKNIIKIKLKKQNMVLVNHVSVLFIHSLICMKMLSFILNSIR